MPNSFYQENKTALIPFDKKLSSSTILLTCLMLFILALLLTPVACTNSAPTPIQDSTKRQWAVVVGIGNYEYLDVDTRYADNDAKVIDKQLENLFGNEHVKPLINSDATKANIRSSIYDWLAPKENADDVVVLYFSGHGNCEYLQMYDSLKGLHDNDISSSEFNDWLNTLESRNVTIIFDVCESGCFGNSITRTGCVIITGGTGREICWQVDTYEHGIFSYYLIEAFNQLDAVDANGDRMISAEELFYYLRLKVEAEFQQYPPLSPQHPCINDNHDGELVLFSN